MILKRTTKELNTKQLVATYFLVKFISFGSSFFHISMAKVLATTNSEPGYLVLLIHWNGLQILTWVPTCLFVWFDSLRPINNLSVIKGQVFLDWTSTKLGLMFLLKDTTQWRRWGLNQRPLCLKSSTLPLCSLNKRLGLKVLQVQIQDFWKGVSYI